VDAGVRTVADNGTETIVPLTGAGGRQFVRKTKMIEGPLKFEIAVDAQVPADAALGICEGELHVGTNDPVQPEVAIPLRLAVVHDYAASPAKVFFGRVKRGQSATRTVVVTRRSAKPVELTAFRLPSDDGETTPIQPTVKILDRRGEKAVVQLTLSVPRGLSSDVPLLTGTIELCPATLPALELPWSCIVQSD
jgi:hypothetical protein